MKSRAKIKDQHTNIYTISFTFLLHSEQFPPRFCQHY